MELQAPLTEFSCSRGQCMELLRMPCNCTPGILTECMLKEDCHVTADNGMHQDAPFYSVTSSPILSGNSQVFSPSR